MTAKENKKIQIIFWGTSEFAIPALEALLRAGYSVAAVVTTPDKPAGRKKMLTPPPIKAWLLRHEVGKTISILQPEKLSDANFKSKIINLKSDIFLVAAYGKMIPADILAIPKYGALNIHPSLLPRWRGPSPIQYAILNGDTKTGVTIMKVDEKMDHGLIVAKSKWQRANGKPIYMELHDMLAKLGAELLVETLPKYLAGEITPMPQDELKATYSKILKKEDGHINWPHPAKEIERMVRAFQPWPRAYAYWRRGEKKIKIDVLKSQIANSKWQMAEDERQKTNSRGQKAKTGTIVREDGKLLVQTGNGLLEIIELQIEGKKPTDAKSFLNGHPDIIDTILI